MEEYFGKLRIDSPNLTINGHDAKIVITKHKGEKWSTALYVSDDKKVYQIVSSKRLEGRVREDFIELAGNLMTVDDGS